MRIHAKFSLLCLMLAGGLSTVSAVREQEDAGSHLRMISAGRRKDAVGSGAATGTFHYADSACRDAVIIMIDTAADENIEEIKQMTNEERFEQWNCFTPDKPCEAITEQTQLPKGPTHGARMAVLAAGRESGTCKEGTLILLAAAPGDTRDFTEDALDVAFEKALELAEGYHTGLFPKVKPPTPRKHRGTVLSMSFGANKRIRMLSPTREYVLESLVTANLAIVVVGAGNYGSAQDVSNMCTKDGVICVGSAEYDGRKSRDSSFGPGIDFFAPGGSIDGIHHSRRGGTSSATAISAGVIASWLAVDGPWSEKDSLTWKLVFNTKPWMSESLPDTKTVLLNNGGNMPYKSQYNAQESRLRPFLERVTTELAVLNAKLREGKPVGGTLIPVIPNPAHVLDEFFSMFIDQVYQMEIPVDFSDTDMEGLWWMCEKRIAATLKGSRLARAASR